ncbi:type IV secretory system conjugative DNA transfer family protein [Roseovarius indicus]|uniref:type IV secretory system conjugative DNA transfer family protein n=1 Tax=Roseovarius indicus TaxID=540747 RepID=UPI0007D93062|nr:type IV secretory system conjugative DNA transfer family protein [Roseovarius indicus]OAO06045.1 hypothetical protein A8B76_03675 [Roseovarius indicus]
MTLLLGWPESHDFDTPVGFAPARPRVRTDKPLQDPNAEGHWLCIAPTGTGKSASFAIPQLLSYPGSVVAVDIKGELVATTARYRRTLGEVLVIDPFQLVSDGSGALNPLSHISADSDSLIDDAHTMANLFSKEHLQGNTQDPFWDQWGQDVIAALIVHAICDEDPARRTLGQVYERFHAGDSYYELAIMLDHMKVHPFTESKLSTYLNLPDVTRGGVMATVCQQLRTLAGEGVRRSLGGNSIDLAALSDGAPSTIYLVLPPDRLHSHSPVVRLILTALLQRLLRRRQRPDPPTLLLVDEAGQLGAMPALSAAITLGRGFGIRAVLLMQSLAQLRNAYGDEHEAILENCSLLTMGKHTAFSMARQLADQGFGDVSAERLFGLSGRQVMIRTNGEPSRSLRKLDYRHDALFKGRFDGNPLYGTTAG